MVNADEATHRTIPENAINRDVKVETVGKFRPDVHYENMDEDVSKTAGKTSIEKSMTLKPQSRKELSQVLRNLVHGCKLEH